MKNYRNRFSGKKRSFRKGSPIGTKTLQRFPLITFEELERRALLTASPLGSSAYYSSAEVSLRSLLGSQLSHLNVSASAGTSTPAATSNANAAANASAANAVVTTSDDNSAAPQVSALSAPVVTPLATPGVATQVVITTPPPSTTTSFTGFSLAVSVEDGNNAVVTTATGTMTLTILTGPAGATFNRGSVAGTTSVTATITNGVATFSNLTLDKVGSYTLQATDGLLTSATTNSIAITPAESIRVEAEDPNTDLPLASSTLTVGQTFTLAVIAQDIRSTVQANPGVFSAYVNVDYPSTLASVISSITYGDGSGNTFSIAKTGDLNTPGLINEAGASYQAEPSTTADQVLFRVTVQVNSTGPAIFAPSFDGTAGHDNLLASPIGDLTADQIQFGSQLLTFVSAANHAPSGTDGTLHVTENTDYVFAASDFGFTDPGDATPNNLLAVEMTTLPATGTVTDNGATVTAGQFIPVADITNGNLKYSPPNGVTGTGVASFTFQVQDDGGTANGGVDTDPTPNTLSINITVPNHAPVGANNTVTTLEDVQHVFTTAEFGFNDPNDTPANTLKAVEITTPPSVGGSLTDNGVAVTAGQFVAATDIVAGLLIYTPNANQNGAGNSTFTFQVQDNGGTAGGGIDTDPTAKTMTVNVTSVNDAPAGTNKTIGLTQDTVYTMTVADFGFTDPNDTPANNLLAVKITTLPAVGSLKDNGVAVTAGQFVAVTDITGGLLKFTPTAGQTGSPFTTFTFQVQDDGGIANGGVDTDPSPNTITFNVVPANHAPQGTDKTISLVENTNHVFVVADFGFSDPSDTPANNLLAVKITTLPANGSLADNLVAVTAGQFIPVADITAGKLVYTPVANTTGTPLSSFTFQVQDDGGTANGGVDTDPTPNTFTINATSNNHAPSGANNTVTTLEDLAHTFTAAEFSFSDAGDTPPNTLLAVKITTLPASGSLTDNGSAVTAGQMVSVTDINAGLLKFTPAADSNGAGDASFTFQVQDNGGTAGGGADTDPTPKTMTINVTSVNDAPEGANKTVTTVQNNDYTFLTSDFGFSDPHDSPPNTLLAVKISSLPASGSLKDNGVAVTAGQFVAVADIAGGLLKFTPTTGSTGLPFATFTFQVQDNGGTANGGVDTDPSPKTISVNVVLANHAPQGTDATISTVENVAHPFTVADFGFSDPNDTPPNNLLAVKISTLPATGTLNDNSVAVTAGQFIPVADIIAGKLVYTPPLDTTGTALDSFTFQVQDDGGTVNGGVDTDPSPNTLTLNVMPPNHAPQGTDKTISSLEDTAYTFLTGDFGFSDLNDIPPNTLLAVEVSSLPFVGTGTLTDNGVAVTAGQFIPVADITGGLFKFTPATDVAGTGAASFTFQVQDNGGILGTGVDTDPTPKTMTFNITNVNDAPQGTSNTVTTLEDTAHTFTVAEFGFSDPKDTPANSLLAVKIATLPATGSLTDNGIAVTAGQFVSAADISGGLLQFTPALNANGAANAAFTFQVQDDGGTANGGVDLDPTARTMTVNVTAVNDAPKGTNNTISTIENVAHTFTVADFGFSDPNDTPANTLLAVEITTLPATGTVTDNGVAVTAGQFVPLADITGGLLKFTPATGSTTTASFTFQVQDNGGTDNGGVDTDPTPRTFTVNVTPPNSAPQGTSNTVTTLEDTAHVFTVAEFGFSDPNDNPPNTLLAVKISTLPATGSLTDNGVAVTAGQFVAVADITGGLLKFTPALNSNGATDATFTFQVQDNGGTANGGVDLDPTPKTMTVSVTAVNDAPSGTSTTITTLEDTAHVFAVADFGFTDVNDNPANTLLAVKITTLPATGSLTDNGVAVTAGQFVAVADITGGLLKFTPALNSNGATDASFTFQVQDNGGTANGGIDTDPTAETMTISVTAVNDAPQGTSTTVTTAQNTARAFTTADFGFTDPNDNPPNALLAVEITTLPSSGTITDNGVAVTAGQFVAVADITGGLLLFTPATGATGNSTFTFQVQDNGGTANGGVDTDPTPRTLTISVTQNNSTITGHVFMDPTGKAAANNGVFSDQDALEGTQVVLQGLDSSGNPIGSPQQFTIGTAGVPDGTFSFTVSQAGSYELLFTPPAGFIAGVPVPGSSADSILPAQQGTSGILVSVSGGGTTSTENFYTPGRDSTGVSLRNLQGSVLHANGVAAMTATAQALVASSAVANSAADGFSQSGSTVTVDGTSGDDSFSFTGGTTKTVTLNGVTRQFGADVTNIIFNGNGGNDSATLTGSAGNDTATLGLGAGTLTGNGYAVSVSGVTTLNVAGGAGQNAATLADSALNDMLSGSGDSLLLTNDAGLSTAISAFATVQANSTHGGVDHAQVGAIDFTLTKQGNWINN